MQEGELNEPANGQYGHGCDGIGEGLGSFFVLDPVGYLASVPRHGHLTCGAHDATWAEVQNNSGVTASSHRRQKGATSLLNLQSELRGCITHVEVRFSQEKWENSEPFSAAHI